MNGLPPDSAVNRDGKAWTQQHEIAATAVERSEMWSGLILQAFGADARDLPPMLGFRRPGQKEVPKAPREVSSDPARIAGFLAMK